MAVKYFESSHHASVVRKRDYMTQHQNGGQIQISEECCSKPYSLKRKAIIAFINPNPAARIFLTHRCKTITKKLETEYVRPVKTCNLHQVEGKSKILGHCI